jgi:hypothetical protein
MTWYLNTSVIHECLNIQHSPISEGIFIVAIFSLFADCSVVGNEEGVHIIPGPDGRASGEAYVELSSPDDVKLALTKNKSHMGRRYIDGTCVLCSLYFFMDYFVHNLEKLVYAHSSSLGLFVGKVRKICRKQFAFYVLHYRK